MAEFFEITTPKEEPKFYEIGSPQTNTVPTVTDALVNYYSTALGRDSESVSRDISIGQLPVLQADADLQANQEEQQRTASYVDSLISSGLPQEEVIFELDRVREGLLFKEHVAPDVALMLSDSPMGVAEKRTFERAIEAERIISEKQAQRSPGTWASIGYFVDAAISQSVHSALGLAEDTTFEDNQTLKELAMEASMLMVSDITPEDFRTRFSDIMDRVAEMGFFSEENPFFLNDFIDMVKESGVGATSILNDLFQFLDVFGVVTSFAGTVAKSPKVIAKLKSGTAAKDIILKAADGPNPSAVVAENTTPSMSTPASTVEFLTGPELNAMRELEAGNKALEIVKSHRLGSFVDPKILAEKEAEWIADITKQNAAYNRNALDYKVEVGFGGRIVGNAYLGTSKGAPYKTIDAATKLAESVGGEVVGTLYEGKTAYVVRKGYDIPTSGLADELDPSDIARGFLHEIMSTTARTSENLDALLKRGEMSHSKIVSELSTRWRKAIRSTPKDELADTVALVKDFRDDPLLNKRTEALTDLEFSAEYFKRYHKDPSPKTVEFYRTLRDISDLDYYLTADSMIKEAVNRGETMVKLNGVYTRARKVAPDNPDEPVWNNITNRVQKWSDIDPDKAVVYEIADLYDIPGTGKVRFVVGDTFTTRRLYHTDVLPYNFGGHRIYDEPLDFFIKQENSLKLADGTLAPARPVTFMAVRTEKEAGLVAKQFNTIVDAANSGAKNIDEIVRRNNDWNLDIESFDDFKNFASERGLDITKKVEHVGDGDPISTFGGKTTYGDAFRQQLNVSKKRGVRPLVGFGGRELKTLDPVKAVNRGFVRSAHKFADQAYLHNAITGWIKAAEKGGAITNAADIQHLAPKQRMLEAKLSSVTSLGKALESERFTIKHRLMATSAQVQAERRTIKAWADWAYSNNYQKLAKSLDWARTSDPAGFIRAMAFHTKLGMFAIDQVYVQASQLISTMGIVSGSIGPHRAMRGMLGVMPMRLALVEKIPPAALKRIAKIQAPFTGVSAEDFIQLRNWLKSTGRLNIGGSLVEINNDVAFLGNRFMDAGQVFFKEGETIARVGAAFLNLVERRIKYGAEDIFDDAVTRKMIHRQDVLTASMTSASAAPWQRSLLAVPLQFTTFHVRMVEQIFTKEILTPSERVSLALMHVFAFGAAAVPGIGYLQDKLAYEGAVDPSTGLYDLVRYGALDAALETLSGEETALSARLAVGEGVTDLFRNLVLGDETLLEVAVGPGGGIIWDSLTAVAAMGKVFKGEYDYVEADVNRLARIVHSYDKGYQMWTALRLGEVTSRKTGDVTLSDMSTVDSYLNALGIPLREREELWANVTFMQQDDRHFEKMMKEMRRMSNVAKGHIRDQDYEAAASVMEDIAAQIGLLTPAEREKAWRRLDQPELPKSVIMNLVKRGNLDVAARLERMIE